VSHAKSIRNSRLWPGVWAAASCSVTHAGTRSTIATTARVPAQASARQAGDARGPSLDRARAWAALLRLPVPGHRVPGRHGMDGSQLHDVAPSGPEAALPIVALWFLNVCDAIALARRSQRSLAVAKPGLGSTEPQKTNQKTPQRMPLRTPKKTRSLAPDIIFLGLTASGLAPCWRSSTRQHPGSRSPSCGRSPSCCSVSRLPFRGLES